MRPRRVPAQGTEPPIPVPIPNLPGIGPGYGVPPPICPGLGSGVHWHPRHHPRFAGDRGSVAPSPAGIPDLPESGIKLSAIGYCKWVENGIDIRL